MTSSALRAPHVSACNPWGGGKEDVEEQGCGLSLGLWASGRGWGRGQTSGLCPRGTCPPGRAGGGVAVVGRGLRIRRGHSRPVCLGALRVRRGLCTELVCGVLGSSQASKFKK